MRMMSKLDRYIVGELVGPFLFGIAVVILLFEGSLLFPLINVIVEKHVPLMQVGRLLLLKVPWLVVWAAPVAMLFASALAVNRMGRDNEITCMRAAGLSLRRIFAPILAAGLVVSVLSFVVGERVVPAAERLAGRIMAEIWMSQSMPEIEPDVFFRTENYCFYVEAVQRKVGSRDVRVQNVMIYKLPDGDKPFPELIVAKYGESRGLQWEFRDGWIGSFQANGMLKEEAKFNRHYLNLKRAVQDFWAGQRQTQEMTLRELKQQMDQFSHGGLPVSGLAVDYHLRLSIPLSCLIFALVSAPLSLRFARAGGFAGLLLSVVLGFLYYNTIFLGKILGTQEVLPAPVAGWMQNILFGAIGLFLILRGE
jgi:lipopolysaccharide export system permease protein